MSEYLQRNQTVNESNPQEKLCTLPRAERLRVAYEVAKGMEHIADTKVPLNQNKVYLLIYRGKGGRYSDTDDDDDDNYDDHHSGGYDS